MTGATDQQAERDLGVLLGIRNSLDRFIELLEADAKRQQTVDLTLQPQFPVLYHHVRSQRADLQDIIDRWPKHRPRVDPNRQEIIYPSRYVACIIEGCRVILPLDSAPDQREARKAWMYARGWTETDAGMVCFRHAQDPEAVAARRAEVIADAGRRMREGTPPEDIPAVRDAALPEMHLRCAAPDCTTTIQLQPREPGTRQDDYLRQHGWTPDLGRGYCPEHADHRFTQIPRRVPRPPQ